MTSGVAMSRPPRRSLPAGVKLVRDRLIGGLLTLLLVSVIVFAATQLLPGNAATSIAGREATPELLQVIEDELQLNRPPLEQYVSWISGVVQGDLGTSFASRRPVTDVLATRAENSIFLVAVAALIGFPFALLMGIVAALRRDSKLDHTVSTSTLVAASLPEFVLALMLILLLATSVFHVLPAVSLLPPGMHAWDDLRLVVLPALTLAIAIFPHLCRIMRGMMIEVLETDYVEMARLKGLSRRRVIFRHAVPNALVPAVQVAALQLAWMAGGVVTVEYVFNYPGLGSMLVEAVSDRDIPVVQAIVLLSAAVYVLVNLLADIATVLLTPRLRTAHR